MNRNKCVSKGYKRLEDGDKKTKRSNNKSANRSNESSTDEQTAEDLRDKDRGTKDK